MIGPWKVELHISFFAVKTNELLHFLDADTYEKTHHNSSSFLLVLDVKHNAGVYFHGWGNAWGQGVGAQLFSYYCM